MDDPLSSKFGELLKGTSQTEYLSEIMPLDVQDNGLIPSTTANSDPTTREPRLVISHLSAFVPPELRDRVFFSLAVRPDLADSNLPTAAPCPICHNFSKDESEIVEFEDATSRGNAGCLGCTIITCAFEKYKRNRPRKSILRSRRSRKHRPPRTLERKLTALISLHDHSIRIIGKKVQPAGERKLSERDQGLDEESVCYEIFTTAATTEPGTSPGIPRGQPRYPLSNSGSRESLDLISNWVHDCSQSHRKCVQAASELPFRVLDLGSGTGVRLTYGAGKQEFFCALSHCWGSYTDRAPICTTKANIRSHFLGINENVLSKTFQDAITVARQLSIRYMWIDSLCIVQDDENEWAMESSKMASIYSNAYLVIAATQAAYGDVGCFSERPYPDATLCFEIPLVDGQNASVYIHEQKDPTTPVQKGGLKDHQHFDPATAHHSQPDPQYPLLSRAWCLQERLLATRMIHFAGDELFWECRNTTLCECGLLGKSGDESYFRQRWTSDHELPDLFDLWHKTIQLYSSLNITYESDRLPALSGLSRNLQARGSGEYVYGVWVQNLFADLFWISSDGGKRPTVWRAPSWSWACGEGFSIIFMSQGNNAISGEVVDSENLWGSQPLMKTRQGGLFKATFESIDHTGRDPCGGTKIDTPVLKISAPTIKVSFQKHSDYWALYRGDSELKVVNCLDCPGDFDSSEGASLLCVWLGTVHAHDYVPMRPQILLLQPSRGIGGKPAFPGCYERVGMVYFRGYDENERTAKLLVWFRDAENHRLQII